MAFTYIRRQPQKFVTRQDTNDPNERPRYWECFGCINSRINIRKVNKEEPRYICVILDITNKEIAKQNESIINPIMKKKLKRCPFHKDVEPEEPLT